MEYENDEVTLTDMSGDEGDTVDSPQNETDCADDIGAENDTQDNDREEYERLIRDKYKEHFTRDTQKLINRRFKKYKALEDKVKKLEEDALRYADINALISKERERAIKETEERMNRDFRANRSRARENAIMGIKERPRMDVAKLTRSERALLATRAQKGEKIHL